MSDNDKIKLSISESMLEDLINGLKTVHSKISTEDNLDIIIDFNTGKIETYVQPKGDYKFEIEF